MGQLLMRLEGHDRSDGTPVGEGWTRKPWSKARWPVSGALVHGEELGHEVVVADPDIAPMYAQRVLFPWPWFRRS